MRHDRRISTAAAVFAAAVMATGCSQSTPADDTAQAPADQAAAVSGGEVTGVASDSAQYLLVQTAPSIRYEDGSLTLESVHDMTVYFTDRPERVAGYLPTSEQIGFWDEGEDSFADDPPNADLVIGAGDDLIQAVVVLTNPRVTNGDLTYDVEVVGGEIPASGGQSALFIDVVGDPLTPVSVAGVSRRTSRRTARRVSRR
jgi:hypothetical protein